MLEPSPTFVGVDPTAGRHPFTFAALDQDRHLVALAAGDVEDVLAFLTGHPTAVVAVNAPPRPNHGLVRKKLEMQNLAPGQLRGSDMRQAESDLREHGISVLPTPSRIETCPAWMQMGFDFIPPPGAGWIQTISFGGRRRSNGLETHPHAAFLRLARTITSSQANPGGAPSASDCSL